MTLPVGEVVCGDCLDVMRGWPDGCIDCCVTSPPYYGLRDYGVQGQIGLEETPEAYIERLVAVFEEVRRLLKPTGTLWLNLGDSYAAQRGGTHQPAETLAGGVGGQTIDGEMVNRGRHTGYNPTRNASAIGLKHKDLLGIPWAVAFALRSAGWWLRSDIIWAKPNPMPESVTDRPTSAHEHIFLLTKSSKYHYDADAIAEKSSDPEHVRLMKRGNNPKFQESGMKANHLATQDVSNPMRNARNVWEISTKPFPGAHFATFPPEIPRRCILAGCPPEGKRCDCDETIFTPLGDGPVNDPSMVTGRAGMNRERRDGEGTRQITRREQRSDAVQLKESAHRVEIEQLCGPAFAHYIRTDKSGARPLPQGIRDELLIRGWLTPAAPCTCPIEPAGIVLDPFAGSGTVGMVAARLGRAHIGIELNPEYAEMARRRTAQQGLFAGVQQ